MKKFALAATALTVAAGVAQAGGLDRSYTPIDVIFEDGNYAELSWGYVVPDLTGVDLLGNPISDVGGDFSVAGTAIKIDVTERLSFALIYDQPYGAEVRYGGSPATSLLGGTFADAETHGITVLAKFKPTDRISVFAGPRAVKTSGSIGLSGLAYGPANGYVVQFGSDIGYGYVVGGAYEIPDIAFRASLTYHSAVDIDMFTVENIPVTAGGPGFAIPTGFTSTETPQSVKLAVQSGIAQDTLLFGSVRWSEWSAFTLQPPALGSNLAQLDDTYTYEIGVGRRFTDKFSASLTFTYEEGGDDNLVSPLAPTNGQTAISLGGRYEVSDAVTLSGGIRYTMFGNALPETGTPDTARGSFRSNDAVSAGIKLGFHF